MSFIKFLWYKFVCFTIKNVFFRVLGGIQVVGLSNIPRTGGVLIAANHTSHFDPPAIAVTSFRKVFFMAKAELFVSWFGLLIRGLGAFPIKRGEPDASSVRKALRILKERQALLVFPEGTRGDGKVMLPFNSGLTMLAKRAGVPVVPVGIVGTHKILPKGAKKISRAATTVVYGEPFSYAQVAIFNDEQQNREAFAWELRKRMIDACLEGGLELSERVVSDTIPIE